MKADVFDINGNKTKTVNLPEQFNEEVRDDLIRKAVYILQSNRRQKYGAYGEAGQRYSAKLSRRRRDFKTSYGYGISRVPRKVLWRRGTRFGWVAAVAPGTVGGRKAHPPKAIKNWELKINTNENRKAIRSALAATVIKDIVLGRGHKANNIPLILDNKFETLNKTKEVETVLIKIGLEKELERTSETKIRAGRGKARGRRYRIKKGPLIVVGNDCELLKSARNLLGVEIARVDMLNAELLAPGASVGRLTIFTEGAIDRLTKERLFANDYKPIKKEQKKVKQNA
ncbi:50S ribosomal protein L4 [Candidatus Woesearchaeota archaeon]|nr:50S ribosomal protein L4 [Candidatus Woesearchaeota archaeon]